MPAELNRRRLAIAGLLTGVPGQRTVVAVLAYRAISPTLPGIGGYVRLRGKVQGWRLADEAGD